MSRVKYDYYTYTRNVYDAFCKAHPELNLTYKEWKLIVYTFNEDMREYMLETGDKVRFPGGLGEFGITKKKRALEKIDADGNKRIGLSIDWVKTRAKGKKVYNFNYHTDGYFFGWLWFKNSTKLRDIPIWYFKAGRTTSRLLAHYLKVDPKYQHMYLERKY